MRRKDDTQLPHGRFRNQFSQLLSPQQAVDQEISIFLSFLNTLPKSTQVKMLPHLQILASDYPNHKILTKFTTFNQISCYTPLQQQRMSSNFIRGASRLYNLTTIGQKLLAIDQKLSKNYKGSSIQEKVMAFEPLNAIHPKFQHYYRMSRELGENAQGLNHEKGSHDSFFYDQPRLFVALQQRNNFKSNKQLNGNILFLAVQGNAVTGRNGLAITKGKNVEWWQKPNQNFKNNLIEDEKLPQQNQDSKLKQNEENSYSKLEMKYKFLGHSRKITSVSVSDDQLYMLTTGADNVVKLWCLRSKMLLAEYKCHMKTIWSVCFNPSGYFFLTGSADGYMKLWKTDDPYTLRVFQGHTADVMKVAFMKNPDFSISSSYDGTVRIWKNISAQCDRIFKFDSPIFNYSISFSGRYLAVCESNGMISILDLIKGSIINSFFIPSGAKKTTQTEKKDKYLTIHDLCFSDNERQFACISNRYIMIYSMDTLSEKKSGNIFSILYEANGQDEQNRNQLIPNEVIRFSQDTSLFYCRYHPKNYLIVAGTSKKY